MTTTILITGATGHIGSFLAGYLGGRYDLILTDVRTPTEPLLYPFTKVDITDLDALCSLCQGVDTVVHLAADPNINASWESLLPRNVVGAYNVFEAARVNSCRRVVFASSVNAVSGYSSDMQVRTDMPVRPANLYGATKAWGEAVAHVYAYQHGLSCICLRFGWATTRDHARITLDNPALDRVLTYEDLGRLVEASITAPDDLRFGVFHGVSNNHWKRLDISDAREVLGYAPEDDSFMLAGLLDSKTK